MERHADISANHNVVQFVVIIVQTIVKEVVYRTALVKQHNQQDI